MLGLIIAFSVLALLIRLTAIDLRRPILICDVAMPAPKAGTSLPARVRAGERRDLNVAGDIGPSPAGQWARLIPGLGHINTFLEWFGDLAIFSWHSLRAAVTPPFEFRELFRQLDEIGSMSLPLVAAAGAAIGAVLSLEARYSLTRFGAKSMLRPPSCTPLFTRLVRSSPA